MRIYVNKDRLVIIDYRRTQKKLLLFGINKPTIYKSDVKINLDVLMVDKLTP